MGVAPFLLSAWLLQYLPTQPPSQSGYSLLACLPIPWVVWIRFLTS